MGANMAAHPFTHWAALIICNGGYPIIPELVNDLTCNGGAKNTFL